MTPPEELRRRWDAGEIPYFEYLDHAFDAATPETLATWLESMPEDLAETFRMHVRNLAKADPQHLFALRGLTPSLAEYEAFVAHAAELAKVL